MTIPPVRPTGRVIVTDVGHHHGTGVVMAGTARGTILGIFPGTILGIVLGTTPGMTLGTMAAMAIMATMVGHPPGAMAGTDLYIIMVVAYVPLPLTIASMPIVM